MPEVRLHLDADTSRKALQNALVDRDRFLSKVDADEMAGNVVWLNQWR